VVVAVYAGTGLDSPGINNDGSGVALLLELVRTWEKRFGATGEGLVNSFRLCWWGDRGDGVEYYVNSLDDSEKKRILMFLSVQAVASINGLNAVKSGSSDPNSPNESGYIAEQMEKAFTDRDQPFEERELFESTDYAKFFVKGIPIGGIRSSGFGLKTEEEAEKFGGQAGASFHPCRGEACDTPDNIGQSRLLLMTRVMADVTQQFLLDKDLPARFGKKKAPIDEPPIDGPESSFGFLQWVIIIGVVLVCFALIGALVVFCLRHDSDATAEVEMGDELKPVDI